MPIRTFHAIELRSLTVEARTMAHSILAEGQGHERCVERALQTALGLAAAEGRAVGEERFRDLFWAACVWPDWDPIEQTGDAPDRIVPQRYLC